MANEPRPPETISMLWCPVCGRDDRFTPFTGKSHFKSHFRMYGIKCEGQPERVEYVLLTDGPAREAGRRDV